MRRLLLLLLLLLWNSTSASATPTPAPAPSKATWTTYSSAWYRVTKIVDGDGIHVKDTSGLSRRVRLRCVDAPELTQEDGQAAKAALASLIPVGSLVRLGRQDADAYGRTLTEVYRKGDREGDSTEFVNVNMEMVQMGWAYVYCLMHEHCSLSQYLPLQTVARAMCKGVWYYRGGGERPWVYRFEQLNNGALPPWGDVTCPPTPALPPQVPTMACAAPRAPTPWPTPPSVAGGGSPPPSGSGGADGPDFGTDTTVDPGEVFDPTTPSPTSKSRVFTSRGSDYVTSVVILVLGTLIVCVASVGPILLLRKQLRDRARREAEAESFSPHPLASEAADAPKEHTNNKQQRRGNDRRVHVESDRDTDDDVAGA